jgi:uncharacterized protein YeaC (DUF1315 family)
MMEAVPTSEMPVYFNETTRRCISEGYHLQFVLMFAEENNTQLEHTTIYINRENKLF